MLHALGANRSRCDGIDADALVRPFDRKVLGDSGGDVLRGAEARLDLLDARGHHHRDEAGHQEEGGGDGESHLELVYVIEVPLTLRKHVLEDNLMPTSEEIVQRYGRGAVGSLPRADFEVDPARPLQLLSAAVTDEDDVTFARRLVADPGIAVVPGSSFYSRPELGRTKIRFAFPKRTETLAEAARRLAELAPTIS